MLILLNNDNDIIKHACIKSAIGCITFTIPNRITL